MSPLLPCPTAFPATDRSLAEPLREPAGVRTSTGAVDSAGRYGTRIVVDVGVVGPGRRSVELSDTVAGPTSMRLMILVEVFLLCAAVLEPATEPPLVEPATEPALALPVAACAPFLMRTALAALSEKNRE